MTVRKADLFTIVCEQPKCLRIDHYRSTGRSPGSKVRFQAAADGWTYHNSKDYCPDHPRTETRTDRRRKESGQ